MTMKKTADKTQKTLTIIGIVLCVILIPILVINCTLIVKSFIKKDEVPRIGKTMPLIVLTDSMYPEIKSGDVIICREIDPDDIEVGDVISFYDPDDRLPVHEDKVIAEYTGTRIPAAGKIALFMQSTTGLILCVIVPIVLFVGYDVLRRRLYEKNKADDVEALKAELEALKRMQNADGTQNAECRMQNEDQVEVQIEVQNEKQSD